MQRLFCEVCGGTELLKDGGIFTCQNCGCQYSLDEVKKMMIEGTVEVQGTVKVDNSDFVQKYLANARRAKEKEDWEETEKYYNMVEQNDPDNIEAIFYSAYAKAKITLVDADIYKREAAFKVLSNCISIIDDHYKPERREENSKAILQMSTDLGKMITSNFVYTKTGRGLLASDNRSSTYVLFVALVNNFKESIDNIAKVDNQIYLHEALINLYSVAAAMDTENSFNTAYPYFKKGACNKIVDEEQEKIKLIRKEMIKDYWKFSSETISKKTALDEEKKLLQTRVDEINAQKKPYIKKIEELQTHLTALQYDLSGSVLGTGKLKKEIQEYKGKIEVVERECETAFEPFKDEFEKASNRIKEIDEIIKNVL